MTPAFSRFVEPARAHAQFWRLAVGSIFAVIVYGLSLMILFFSLWLFVGRDWIRDLISAPDIGNTPTEAIFILYSFLGMGIGGWAAARLLHRRGFGTLVGRRSVFFANFFRVMVLVAIIFGLVDLIFPATAAPVENIRLSRWLALLPITLLGLFIQTGAEELVFRGYLQQQLAALANSRLVWMLIPSLIFGILHYDAANGQTAWAIAGATVIFGLIAADLTARTGNLGAACGLHFANNAFALAYVALDGTITGLALYKTPFGPGDTEILMPLIFRDVILLIVTWLTVRHFVKPDPGRQTNGAVSS